MDVIARLCGSLDTGAGSLVRVAPKVDVYEIYARIFNVFWAAGDADRDIFGEIASLDHQIGKGNCGSVPAQRTLTSP